MSRAKHASRRKWDLLGLIAVLVLSAGLRFWRLGAVPPGLTHDEAGHGQDAVAILRGARPIYQTVGYGREPLFDYLVAAFIGLFHSEATALRFVPVLLNLITIFLTFVWARLAFDRTIGLTAVAFQAASFWSLTTSRQALRSSLLPPLFAAAVFFYWRAVYEPLQVAGRTHSPWRLMLSGLLIGATFYTYIPSRILWIVFLAFLVYLAFVHREVMKRVWRPSLTAVLIGLLVAVPLFSYLMTHPEAEQRLKMLDAPVDALRSGDVSLILTHVRDSIAAYFLPGRGDDFLAYNIPGRPVFDPLTGGLFLLGLAISLTRWRRPAYAFSLIWFLVGISPSLVTGATASTTRSIGALPIVFLFPALAVVVGLRSIRAHYGLLPARVAGICAVGLIIITAAVSARDYFVRWGESADVRAAYQHTLIQISKYVESEVPSGTVSISSVHPNAPHDPYVFMTSLMRDDISLRWADARRAIILPHAEEAWLIVPSSAQLSPYLAELPGIELEERVFLREDDLDPYFAAYDWRPRISRGALQRAMRRDSLYSNLDVSAPLEAPVSFGNALHLLGYDLLKPHTAQEESVELVTFWEVTDSHLLRAMDPSDTGAQWVFFVHALDSAGSLLAQDDRLDAPAWSWENNDVIAQMHQFDLPSDRGSGSVILAIGVYERPELTRLPVVVDGVEIEDRVILLISQLMHP